MDSLLPTPILEVFLVLFTSTMDFHNPSTTSRNKYGDNGNTYLKPLVVLKKGEVETHDPISHGEVDSKYM